MRNWKSVKLCNKRASAYENDVLGFYMYVTLKRVCLSKVLVIPVNEIIAHQSSLISAFDERRQLGWSNF